MVVSKPRPKDHLALRILLRQPQSVHRRVNDADIGAAGFRLQKRAVLPGTRMASPKVQKITPGRLAISMQASMRPIGRTHTGQPGP
nr:Uncharacterised protein [Klebsiella pneumoniae]